MPAHSRYATSVAGPGFIICLLTMTRPSVDTAAGGRNCIDTDHCLLSRLPNDTIGSCHRASPIEKVLVSAILPLCPIGRPQSSDTKPVEIPRSGYPLNTRRWDLPDWGELTRLRGQAALQAPGRAGNPSHAHCPIASALGAAGAALLPRGGSRDRAASRPVIPSSAVPRGRRRAGPAAGRPLPLAALCGRLPKTWSTASAGSTPRAVSAPRPSSRAGRRHYG